MKREYKTDSYIIDIIPPGESFPAVWVYRRKKSREHGEIAADEQVEGSPSGDP